MKHQDIADKVAGNIARKTGHPIEDLRQIAMLGIIQASRRYEPQKGRFRPYARNYANGEVYHFLRSRGFLLKVPPSWRELHSRGRRLLMLGAPPSEVPSKLRISATRWDEIQHACSLKVISSSDIAIE
jgi:DNA-directed RNA polymerase specialized sigma subunit